MTLEQELFSFGLFPSSFFSSCRAVPCPPPDGVLGDNRERNTKTKNISKQLFFNVIGKRGPSGMVLPSMPPVGWRVLLRLLLLLRLLTVMMHVVVIAAPGRVLRGVAVVIVIIVVVVI